MNDIGRRHALLTASRGDRHIDGEYRAMPLLRRKLHGMPQHRADTPDNRQPQAKPAFGFAVRCFGGPLKLFKNTLAIRLGNTRPGIEYLYSQVLSPASTAEQHLALRRVAQGIAQ